MTVDTLQIIKTKDEMNSIHAFLKENAISFSENVDLKNKTWIKSGGIAALWIEPEKLSDFEKVIILFQEQNIVFETIGNTSNLDFLNTYFQIL